MGILDFFRRGNGKPDSGRGITRRGYAAARAGRIFGGGGTQSSADTELRASLAVMRNRSRELVRDNEFARRYVNLIKANIVGDAGFRLQVKARNGDGSLDRIGNDQIERAFKAWGRVGRPTVDGRLSWIDCQKLAAESLVRDGEAFIRIVQGREYKHGIALQFIEADLIDENKNERLANGNHIRMGVEIGPGHRPIAYHILTNHPGDSYYHNPVARKTTRVPADEMIHLFMPTRTHQTRGEPFMAPAMSAMRMMQGYREAEVTAARLQASQMGVITTPTGDEFAGDQIEREAPVIDVEPGAFHQLPPGFDIKMFSPEHPNSGFAAFEKAMLRGVASGLNVSYASLSNDLSSVNYSSIRQGALDERDGYRALQSFFIEHFVEIIYRRWLSSVMDFGYITIPASKFDKFADNSHFRGRGWNWVDPMKEISAAIAGLENGILSMQDVAANYGRDVEETFSQISRDKEIAEQFGLSLAFEPFGSKEPAEPQEVDDEDQDEA